jgi:hypothetical protein
MAKGYLPLPDGSYVTVRDDETPEQAFARARKEYPEAFEVKRVPAEPEEGVMARWCWWYETRFIYSSYRP